MSTLKQNKSGENKKNQCIDNYRENIIIKQIINMPTITPEKLIPLKYVCKHCRKKVIKIHENDVIILDAIREIYNNKNHLPLNEIINKYNITREMLSKHFKKFNFDMYNFNINNYFHKMKEHFQVFINRKGAIYNHTSQCNICTDNK